MARKPTAPAAPAIEAQQPEKLPYYLEALRPIFELLERFVEGDKSAQEKLRSDVAAARQNRDLKGNLDAALGKLVVIGGLPITLFGDVLDEKSARWLTRKADELVRCANEAGTTVQAWSKDEARRVLDLYKAKHRTPAKRSVMAILAAPSSAFSVLESWAYPRARVTKDEVKERISGERQKLELEEKITELEAQESEAVKAKDYAKAGEIATAITTLRQEMANLTTTATAPAETVVERDEEEVDEKTPSIGDRIAELEAQESEAVKAKDYARAGELATQIAALHTEVIENLEYVRQRTPDLMAAVSQRALVPVAVPVATPVAAAAAPAVQPDSDTGSSEFTVDDAIDLCTSEKATPDMKRLMERRAGKGKPLTDSELIRKAQALGKLSKLL